MSDGWTVVVLALGFGWLLQYVFAFFQLKRFYRRLHQLRQYGTVSVGKEGTAWRGRIYMVVVVDKNKRIRRVEQLSGWTIFAALRPFPGLEGYHLNDLFDDQGSLPVTHKQLLALRNAAEYILEAEKQRQSDENAYEDGTEPLGSSSLTLPT